MKICIDCKLPQCSGRSQRCEECRKRSAGKRLKNADSSGYTLCLCGCGKPAEAVYLTDKCYAKHNQRRIRNRWPSLLNACPLWYGRGVLTMTNRPFVKPTPYQGPELADVVPDDLFAREFSQALRHVGNLPMIGEGMST
jgi:hypothetical protein